MINQVENIHEFARTMKTILNTYTCAHSAQQLPTSCIYAIENCIDIAETELNKTHQL